MKGLPENVALNVDMQETSSSFRFNSKVSQVDYDEMENDGSRRGFGSAMVDASQHWERPSTMSQMRSTGRPSVETVMRSTGMSAMRSTEGWRSCPSLFGGDTTRPPTSGALMSVTSSSWKPNWHTRSSRGRSDRPMTPSGKGSLWSPLGSTWRRRDVDEDGFVRSNVDDSNEFINGCVPAWGRSSTVRKGHSLEHELTWAYYQMRRHVDHPQRRAVGEKLPLEDIPQEMRVSKNEFQFWRDLRPPFKINKADIIDEGNNWHPDGELFEIKYECGIDYISERMCPAQGEAGTHDIKARGVARVRVPYKFPAVRPVSILSWGRPFIAHTLSEETETRGKVPEEIWNPLASELGQMPTAGRLDGARVASKACDARVHMRPVQVKPLQRLALGPHASLPRLAKADRSVTMEFSGNMPRAKAKPRIHRICTSSCGFIKYVG